MDSLINSTIKPFDDRLTQLKSAYTKNDTAQGTDFKTSTNNILKS